MKTYTLCRIVGTIVALVSASGLMAALFSNSSHTPIWAVLTCIITFFISRVVSAHGDFAYVREKEGQYITSKVE